MFQLMWNAQLKIVNENICKLLNKVGKLPKERLCKQDTGLSDYQITLFLTISSDFLKDFIEATEESHQNNKIQLHFENIWENGPQALVELAIQQREVCFESLHLHYQLILVLQLIATFPVKCSKPVNSLFEASMVNMLFTDMQKKNNINWSRSDLKIHSSRIQFLYKVISASLETITISEPGRVYSNEHVLWISKCFTLGTYWSIELDLLRQYQIVKLYINGYDSLAQELIPSVTERNNLGKQLLKIGTHRLSNYLTLSSDLGKNITALSPTLTNYMENLVSRFNKFSMLCLEKVFLLYN